MNTARMTTPPNVTAVYDRTEYTKGTYDVEWVDYTLYWNIRGRSYRIAALTEYPDGRCLLVRAASLRGSTQHSTWSACIRAIGMEQVFGQVMYVTE